MLNAFVANHMHTYALRGCNPIIRHCQLRAVEVGVYAQVQEAGGALAAGVGGGSGIGQLFRTSGNESAIRLQQLLEGGGSGCSCERK